MTILRATRKTWLASLMPLAILAGAIGFALAAQATHAAPDLQVEPRPVEPVDCKDACNKRARAAFDECVAGGGSAERCKRKAKGLLDECLKRCEKPPEPKPVDCKDACNKRARAAFDECVGGGGSAERCKRKAKGLLDECLKRCEPSIAPKPRPIDCKTGCKQKVEAWLERCQGGADECNAKARKLLADCLTRCEPSIAPKPRPIDCETGCKLKVDAWAKRCIRSGGEDCRAQARRLLQRCLASCEGPSIAPRRPIKP